MCLMRQCNCKQKGYYTQDTTSTRMTSSGSAYNNIKMIYISCKVNLVRVCAFIKLERAKSWKHLFNVLNLQGHSHSEHALFLRRILLTYLSMQSLVSV